VFRPPDGQPGLYIIADDEVVLSAVSEHLCRDIRRAADGDTTVEDLGGSHLGHGDWSKVQSDSEVNLRQRVDQDRLMSSLVLSRIVKPPLIARLQVSAWDSPG
jgi:hypothetical protein